MQYSVNLQRTDYNSIQLNGTGHVFLIEDNSFAVTAPVEDDTISLLCEEDECRAVVRERLDEKIGEDRKRIRLFVELFWHRR
jgi:hypothetical protein